MDAAGLAAAMLAAGAISTFLLRQDVNWDLRNYHFYNAWAFVHGRLGWDLAPAQSPTFHNPLPDLPFYWMVAADWPPRVIAFFMALPAGVGAFFLAKILLLLFGELSIRERWAYAVLAFAIGVTASGPVSLLGSTMNDWPPAALVMIALWLLLRRIDRDAAGGPTLAVAGALSGIAVGLKYTNATFLVGIGTALWFNASPRRAIKDVFTFGIAAAAGILLAAGEWMWTLYTHFGSPLFPYFNSILHSPWWDANSIVDPRFGPPTLIGWLTFPLPLFGTTEMYVAEPPIRDWRLPMLYLALVASLIAWAVRRRAVDGLGTERAWPKWRFLLVFWGTSFAIWAALYAIYRYILALELLSGALLVYFLSLSIPRRWLAAATAICAALAIFTVQYPRWGRIDYGDHYFSVKVPPVAPRALVLLVDSEPLAFILPFFPADGRYVGANNLFNDPSRRNRLAREVARVIRDHDGPLYALSARADAGTAALEAHQLHRAGDCEPIATNASTLPAHLCRLERTGRRNALPQ